jgi:probable rRNA maturation factor
VRISGAGRPLRPPAPVRLALAIQGRARFAGLPAASTLRRWVRLALRRDAELTLRFVGSAESRRLNRGFRGKDRPTNVLTFAHRHAPTVWADIVLCVPQLRVEARAQGKPLRAHLAHLIVHGVLHAQGWDHATPVQARRMEAHEIALLARLRIPNPYE